MFLPSRSQNRNFPTSLIKIAALLFACGNAYAGPEDPGEGGQWGAVIDWPHIAVSAANLPDGRILTWSGSERETWPTDEQTYSATWDPQTGEFVEIFHDTHNMFCAHLAMLEDGRVFVNGGRNQTNSPWTSIFDFRDDGWVQIENMASGGRWYPTTLALADGDIMTSIGTASLQQYPERWNIDSGWDIQNGIDYDAMVLTPYFNSGSHGESRWWPLLHVAPNGEVLHSGPTPQMHYIDPAGNGSYTPVTPVGPDLSGEVYHKHGTTIMYDAGKLLTAGGWVAGGDIASSAKAFTIDVSIEGEDPADPTPIVATTNDMHFARKFHNGVMLPTGDVLVIGGNTSGLKFRDDGSILETEIWDPDTGTWTIGAAMATPRNYHSIALLLTDGRVLAAGSGYCSGSVVCNGASHKDAEIYSPAYLFNADNTPAVRPSITSGPARVTSGNTFAVTGTAGLARFTMIKMSSTTHGLNTDVRFVNVDFTETSAGVYELTAHSNQNVLTPGYWMLFGLDANDVPSVAHVVQANTSGQPWIASVPQQSSQEGEGVNVEITAGDMDDDPLAYSAVGLPEGLSINPTSGVISGAATTAGVYNVTVSVTDNDEGSKDRSFDWLVFGQGLGSIRRDWWTGISGTAVSDLTSNANYPDAPTGSDSINSFETPTNWADNYGTRVHGYITPTQTGNYTFAIATDDGGELWLSSDGNPANRQLIASVPGWAGPRDWDKFAEQQSSPIALVAGETYYIEALQKEGGGGDNLAVGWIRPGQSAIEVIPGAVLSPDNVSILAPAEAQLYSGTVSNVGSDWLAVNLPDTYDDMVVVATPEYQSTDLPVVTRVRNLSGNTFEVRVQNPGDGAIPSTYTVHYIVAEKGVYSGNGARMEVATTAAAAVDSDTSWVGQAADYQQAYASPVVVGQVIGDNDPDWSVFWASDGTQGNPPSSAALSIGRHVAEDAVITRAADTLGYFVFDAGSVQVGNWFIEAGLGGNTVAGMDDAPPYSYPLLADAERAVLAAAGMNGGNGGWPVLYGPTPFAGTALALAFDEDQLNDAERNHASEEVAYVALAEIPDEPLQVDPLMTTATTSGTGITFDAIASGGTNLEYNWNFGDNTGETGFGAFGSINHTYAAAGRYVISLTVRDMDTGEEITVQFIQLIHWPLDTNPPTASSTIALNESLDQIWSVNPDNDTVTVITDVAMSLTTELATDDHPVAVQIAPNGKAWVVNRKSSTISVYNASPPQLDTTIQLPAGSAPYGIAFHHGEDVALVMLEGTGDLVKLNATSFTNEGSVYVGDDARHVSVRADDGKVLVTRFVTPTLPDEWTANPIVEFGGQKFGGEVVIVDLFSMSVEATAVLQHSDRVASEHTGPGVPNYLGAAAVSPDGRSAWVASKQDNILAGALRGGPGMTFDQTVRAITSKVDLAANAEDFAFRVDHDNASVGKYATFGPYGAYLFTTLEGNREIAISDAYTGAELGRFDVGRAPHGVVTSSDGLSLYVHNFMDRSVGVYDISEITQNNNLDVTPINTITTVSSEALAADVLTGKQFFYDARDPRLALHSYMSCASCHNNGGQDGRVWDFTGVGEGLRNTIMLRGRAAMAHGFLHWSANFNELQDFEDQIRNFSVGTGLMDQADYDVGDRNTPMGLDKAGISADLDALAAYVDSLDEFDDSPHRNADGSLTAAGEAGRLVYESAGCGDCHAAPRFTDSIDESTLHDIGTINPSTSGNRLGGALTGIDTPTLISLWNTGPYLHDGSAIDITEAVAAHSGTSLTAQQLNDLGAYLNQLDSVTALVSGDTGCNDCIDFSVTPTTSYSNQDATAQYEVQSAGAAIRLSENTWRWTDREFTVTPTTMLEFTFESTQQGEIQGIGLSDNEDLQQIRSRLFQLWGTQSWAIRDYLYSGSGPQSFIIPIGQYFTGSGFRLVLVNDDDAAAASDSLFSNVRVYDPGQAPEAPVIVNPGDQISTVGSSVNLAISASDSNSDVLSFTASNLPTGLSISTDGVVSGLPTEVNTWAVEVTVTDNISGSDSAFFDWTVIDQPSCTDCVDFSSAQISSYSNQDADSNVQVLDFGATIQLSDNTWAQSDTTYTITPTTMLDFSFNSSLEGEIHGIGLTDSDDLTVLRDRLFQVWGTQNYGITDYQYDGIGTQHFQIPVGQYFTGTNLFLVFVNDDDAGIRSDSRFSDVRIYDPGQAPVPPSIVNPGDQLDAVGRNVSLSIDASDANGDQLEFSAQNLPTGLSITPDGTVLGTPTEENTWSVTVTVTDNISGSDSAVFNWTTFVPTSCTDCIDFSTLATTSFANQDVNGNIQVLNGGQTVQLADNTWRISDPLFSINANTVLEFVFDPQQEGEIQGIGFITDNSIAAARDGLFQLLGTQKFGIQDFVQTWTGPTLVQIPIGTYYSGQNLRLILASDDDSRVGSSATYSDVRLYEPGN